MSLIGIKDFFTVTCILYVFMLLSNVLALFMVETIGRRPILLVGMCILTVIELVSPHAIFLGKTNSED